MCVEFFNSDRTKRRRRRTDEEAAHPGGLFRFATRHLEGGSSGQQRCCGRQRRRRGRSLFVFGMMNLSFFSTTQHVNAFGEVVCLGRFVTRIEEVLINSHFAY